MKVDYWMHYYDIITNPRWRTVAPANTKIVMSAYLSENYPITYDEIWHWYTESDSDSDKNDLSKTQNSKFKMAYGRHFGKHLFWP